ncbi:3-deoxy-manno-octulosonate cytidylyltransferase [Candidatus Magnetomoraceae bacterium gMMP-15]
MQVTAIIPSRYQSSRFEGKPLALIRGKSMIQRVYERSSKSELVNEVVAATDDQRIYDAVTAFGGKAVMTSKNHKSGTDRISEAASILGLKSNDIIINVQGDQPLIHPECLTQVISPFKSEPKTLMSTLAFKIINPDEKTNPKDVKVVFDNKGYALYFSRSLVPFARNSSLSFDVYKHLGIYAYTLNFLKIFNSLPEGRLESIEKLEQLRALEFGYPIRVLITQHDSPEVDLPQDIKRIENL